MRFASGLFACSFLFFSASVVAVPPGTEAEIRARLKPAGSVCMVGDNTCGSAAAAAGPAGTGLSGKDIYGSYCFACHATGAGGAPTFGNAAAWAPHIKKGMDTLWQSAINGLPPGMPPRGTCMACSDDELKTAFQYMVNSTK